MPKHLDVIDGADGHFGVFIPNEFEIFILKKKVNSYILRKQNWEPLNDSEVPCKYHR
jgi:hypothetical protein